jgi:branched-chain amino acid transport system substrate-binding protein
MRKTWFAALALAAATTGTAFAADPVKIGWVTTLSGPLGYAGEDMRDGFLLAVEEEGGKLGGVPVQVMVEDDGFKPGQAKQIADKFMKQHGAKIISGTVASNIMVAIAQGVADADAIFISPNAGPSTFAGKGCNKNIFVTSWQNDEQAEAAGAIANHLGKRKMYIVAANYQAGKDAAEGFKRTYKGQVVDEAYTKLDQTDYSAEIAKIRQAKPDALFTFLPAALGIGFIKQYAQAGLGKEIPLVVSYASIDQKTIEATGDATVGFYYSTHWNPDFENAESKAFVAAFTKRYKRAPIIYASQGYETAKIIAGALKQVKGDVSNLDSVRAAIKKADFKPLRGSFQFGHNNYARDDWYAVQVLPAPNGKAVGRTLPGKVLTAHATGIGAECQMK